MMADDSVTVVGITAPAEEELIDAINQLIADAAPDPIDDLIVDLRYNSGGFGIIASQLAYMVAGPDQTDGRTFDRLQFNDKHTTVDIFGNPILPDGVHRPRYGGRLRPGFEGRHLTSMPGGQGQRDSTLLEWITQIRLGTTLVTV